MSLKSEGVYNATPPTLVDGQSISAVPVDLNANPKVTMATSIAGEDISNDVLKVEERYSYNLVTSDTLIKSGVGFLHSITFSPNDATPTAGTIIVYDNTAESGTQIFNWSVATIAFIPFTVILDVSFSVGCYVGFTTTADVNVTVSYR
jgi:hypothetical protein